jgi:LysM repeat protein
MAKKTGKKPYKFRQARKDAKAGAKGVFTGKRKAAVKDITTKQTLEEREALKELSDARKRQKAGKADFIVDDRGQRVDVKPTETAQERFARDRAAARAEALRKYPLDEAELGKENARKARMEAKNKAAIAKQKADKAKNLGKPAPTLQQTPANEKPLSRPVKKAGLSKPLSAYSFMKDTPPEEYTAEQRKLSDEFIRDTNEKLKPNKATVKKGTVGTTKKPDAKGVAKAVKKAKEIQSTKKAKEFIGTNRKEGLTPKVEKEIRAKASMTRAERSAANKAAWKNMSPAERKNWSANKPVAGKAIKPAKTFGEISKAVADKTKPAVKAEALAPKRPTLADLKKNEAKGLAEAKKRVAAKNQALANSAKGKTQTPQAKAAKVEAAAKPEGKAAAKKITPKKFGKTRAIVKGGVIGALAVEAGSIAKGSTEKDWKEIQRLENKLAALKGQKPKYKNMGSNKNPIAAMKADLGNLASNASMGIVGKTRRARMDELNRMITKQEKKNTNKASKPSKPDYSVRGRGPAAQVKITPTAGGSTISSDKYTVQKGDTLSGIAKTAGVSLSELRAANPAIMKRKKYKQGAMIWSGTKVNIPKK